MLEVEFYGVLQQVAGSSKAQLQDIEEGVTVSAALDYLRDQYPALADHLPRVACAQGDSLVRRDQIVDTSRPLVLLPPVSGG